MTRKDFELIARTIKELHQWPHSDGTVNKIAEKFADALAGTNANFDRARFLKACGYAQ